MTPFSFEKLDLDGAYLINNFNVGDNRGGFTKLYEKITYESNGLEFNLSESFASISSKNVIRGLHFQINNPQIKIVSVLKGRVWDVIVDLRTGSKTYTKWLAYELSDENHKALFVPRGFAHGFVSLEDDTIMLYQCDGIYDKETDTGIVYNDPDIGIKWPIDLTKSIHSTRDMNLMSLKDYEKNPINY